MMGAQVARTQRTAMSRTQLHVPLYSQVLGVLRQRIADGIYGVDDQIPPEDQLAAEFDVSRATVRQAVGELVREGLVDRKQGRGTFVLPTAHRYGQRLNGSLSTILAQTKTSQATRIDVDRSAQVPARIAEALQLDEPIATVFRRPRAVKGQIWSYTVNYLPDHFGKFVTRENLRAKGMIGVLESHGVHCASARQIIRAHLADVEVCRHMEMDFAGAVLYAERVVLSVDEEPVQFVTTWYRADMFEYEVHLKLNPDAGEGESWFLLA